METAKPALRGKKWSHLTIRPRRQCCMRSVKKRGRKREKRKKRKKGDLIPMRRLWMLQRAWEDHNVRLWEGVRRLASRALGWYGGLGDEVVLCMISAYSASWIYEVIGA